MSHVSIEYSPMVQHRELFLSPLSMTSKGLKRAILRKGILISVRMTLSRQKNRSIEAVRSSGYTHLSRKEEVGKIVEVWDAFMYSSEAQLKNAPHFERSETVIAIKEKAQLGDIIVLVTNNHENTTEILLFSHDRKQPKVTLFLFKSTQHFVILVTVDLCDEQNVPDAFKPCVTTAPNVAELENGEEYLVYRFFLYSDGFTPTLGKKGSMGGCYMLPLGMHPEQRTIGGAVRRLALTPPGVSANHIFNIINADIEKGVTEGFPLKRIDGSEVRIFLDPVGHIGDYPAASDTLDVLGHNSNAPCTICSFKKSSSSVTKYCYTSSITSSHISFRRTYMRYRYVRENNTKENELFTAIGLHPNEHGRDLPFHDLTHRLSNIRRSIPKTSEGVPVVPGMFDPYLSNIIGPDHLFSGLGRNAIDAIVLLLTTKQRKVFNSITINMLSNNEMSCLQTLLSKNGTELVTLSISEMYDVLFVAPIALDITIKCPDEKYDVEAVSKCIDSLKRLTRLISDTQNTQYSLRDVNVCFPTKCAELCSQAHAYMDGVKDICDISRPDRVNRKLDKPNMHRLIEFYEYTLPSFGNISHLNELLFERAHQEMKQAVVHSNYQNPQLQAMFHVNGNDWVNWVAHELKDVTNDNKGWNEDTYRSVLRLLGNPAWDVTLFNETLTILKKTSSPHYVKR